MSFGYKPGTWLTGRTESIPCSHCAPEGCNFQQRRGAGKQGLGVRFQPLSLRGEGSGAAGGRAGSWGREGDFTLLTGSVFPFGRLADAEGR